MKWTYKKHRRSQAAFNHQQKAINEEMEEIASVVTLLTVIFEEEEEEEQGEVNKRSKAWKIRQICFMYASTSNPWFLADITSRSLSGAMDVCLGEEKCKPVVLTNPPYHHSCHHRYQQEKPECCYCQVEFVQVAAVCEYILPFPLVGFRTVFCLLVFFQFSNLLFLELNDQSSECIICFLSS